VDDYNSDGIPDRMIKFARDQVVSYLSGQAGTNLGERIPALWQSRSDPGPENGRWVAGRSRRIFRTVVRRR
jgi:hypothetical protein